MNNMSVNESDQMVTTQLAYAHLNTAVDEIIKNRSMQEKIILLQLIKPWNMV